MELNRTAVSGGEETSHLSVRRPSAGRLEGETAKEYRERLKEEYQVQLERAMAQLPRRKEGTTAVQGGSARGRGGVPPVQPGRFHPADMKRTREVLCAIPVASTPDELRHKEIVYLCRRKKAMRAVLTLIWDSTEQALRKIASARGWGDPPAALKNLLVKPNAPPKTAAEVRALWPAPFKSLEDTWDETYLREFAEVTERFHWGQESWKSFLTPWSRDFLGDPPPFVARNTGWAPIRLHTREIQCQGNRAREVDEALRLLGVDEDGKGQEASAETAVGQREGPSTKDLEVQQICPVEVETRAVVARDEVLVRTPVRSAPIPAVTQVMVEDPALAMVRKEKSMEFASAVTLQRLFQEGGGSKLMQSAVEGLESAESAARRHVREAEGLVRELEFLLVQARSRVLRAKDDLTAIEYAVHATRGAKDVWTAEQRDQASKVALLLSSSLQQAISTRMEDAASTGLERLEASASGPGGGITGMEEKLHAPSRDSEVASEAEIERGAVNTIMAPDDQGTVLGGELVEDLDPGHESRAAPERAVSPAFSLPVDVSRPREGSETPSQQTGTVQEVQAAGRAVVGEGEGATREDQALVEAEDVETSPSRKRARSERLSRMRERGSVPVSSPHAKCALSQQGGSTSSRTPVPPPAPDPEQEPADGATRSQKRAKAVAPLETVIFRDLGKEMVVPTKVPGPPFRTSYFSDETKTTYTPKECEAMWRYRRHVAEPEAGSEE